MIDGGAQSRKEEVNVKINNNYNCDTEAQAKPKDNGGADLLSRCKPEKILRDNTVNKTDSGAGNDSTHIPAKTNIPSNLSFSKLTEKHDSDRKNSNNTSNNSSVSAAIHKTMNANDQSEKYATTKQLPSLNPYINSTVNSTVISKEKLSSPPSLTPINLEKKFTPKVVISKEPVKEEKNKEENTKDASCINTTNCTAVDLHKPVANNSSPSKSDNCNNGYDLNTDCKTWIIDNSAHNTEMKAVDKTVLDRAPVDCIYESAAKLLFLGVKWARSIPSFMQVRHSR